MKQFKSFAVALAALTMFSCQKEDGTITPGATPVGEPTYATFSFNTSGISTRAGGALESDGGQNATADATAEKVIKTARMLIFSETGVLENNKVVTLDGNSKFTELVKSGPKRMFVIANENAAMAAKLTADLNLTTFLALTYDAGTPGDAAFTLAPLFTKSADMGFPMSSSNARTYTFVANVSQSAAEGGTTEATNTFSIGLDFMLAKVAVVAKDATTFDNAIMTITTPTYSVRNIAKETFYTQQFGGNGIVVGPYYDTNANWGTSFDSQALPTEEVTVGAPTAGTTPFVYAAENTKSNSTLLRGGTTYAHIMCTLAPKTAYTGGADMKWDPINSEVVMGKVEAIVSGEDFVVSKITKGKIKANDVFKDLDALKKAVALTEKGADYGDGNLPATELVANQDYTLYTNGVAYYQIYVGNTTDAFGQKYGVKRGMQYTATINSITGFGSNNEDIMPGEPVEQNTYINVTIQAKGWTAGGSSTDL